MKDELVVITGASTGIGRAAAVAMAAAGYYVLAGVRREVDADALRAAGAGIEPVILDVRDEGAIAALRQRVEADGRPLAALVNNAGAMFAGMAEVVPVADWRQQFEINVFGAVAMTQALLPALRRSRGRVISISSIGGKTVAPGVGVYQSSKYALEAFSDALRLETKAQGITVVIVEPGAIRTPIWDKTFEQVDRQIAAMKPEFRQLYAARTRGLAEGGRQMEKMAIKPEAAAKVILRALTARRPRTRYLVGIDARLMATMKWLLPDRWFDAAILWMMRERKPAAGALPVSA